MENYYSMGLIDAIDLIESSGGKFIEGNIIKYIFRLGYKYEVGTDDFQKDVDKIVNYYNMMRDRGRRLNLNEKSRKVLLARLSNLNLDDHLRNRLECVIYDGRINYISYNE